MTTGFFFKFLTKFKTNHILYFLKLKKVKTKQRNNNKEKKNRSGRNDLLQDVKTRKMKINFRRKKAARVCCGLL